MYTLNNIAIFKIKYMQMYYLERTSYSLSAMFNVVLNVQTFVSYVNKTLF